MADKTQRNVPTVEELKAPLLAAVGAADLALERVNEIVVALRERAEDARTDASTRVEETRGRLTSRVEETRGRLTKLQEDLPKHREELRDRLNSDELRKAAEGYREQATDLYQSLVARGEAALERLRSQPGFEESRARAEQALNETVELTQEALGNVATQTRAVGERAAALVGVDLPKKEAPAKKAPAKKAAAKKAPAKAAAKAPAKAPAKAAAKTTAKKAPAKKAAAKKVTQK